MSRIERLKPLILDAIGRSPAAVSASDLVLMVGATTDTSVRRALRELVAAGEVVAAKSRRGASTKGWLRPANVSYEVTVYSIASDAHGGEEREHR